MLSHARRIVASCAVILVLALLLSPVTAHGQNMRTVTLDRGVQDPAVSPDGSRIAVGIIGDLWLVPIEGGAASQLTTGAGWDAHPAWSPDGRFMAYSHRRRGHSDLVLRTMATGGTRTLYSTEHSIGQIAFHPTEAKVFFVRDLGQYEAHLWSVPTSGDGAQQVTHGTSPQAEWSFALSPDGSEVALEWVRFGPADLFRMTLDSVPAVDRLTETPHDEFGVQWTADGASLIY